jgi:CII-binding regulator of phage lambda lysogenization HflD
MPGIFSRKGIAEAAKELSNHLQLVEHVKALQTGQKDLADAIASLGQRLNKLEAQVQAVRADTKLDAIREVQTIVNSVQGNLNQRIETLAIKVALQEAGKQDPTRLPSVGSGNALSAPVVGDLDR